MEHVLPTAILPEGYLQPPKGFRPTLVAPATPQGKISVKTVPVEMSERRSTRLLPQFPDLEKAAMHLYTTNLIAPEGEDHQALVTNNRTALLDDVREHLTVPQIPFRQESCLEIKGWGCHYTTARTGYKGLRPEDMDAIVKALGVEKPEHPFIVSKARITIGGPEDPRPYGGEEWTTGAKRGLANAERYYNQLPIKIAPTLWATRYPARFHRAMRVIADHQIMREPSLRRYPERAPIYQSARLMPSNIRGRVMDRASKEDLCRICNLLNSGWGLERTIEELVVDTRRYLEVPSQTTQKAGKTYDWTLVGDVHWTWGRKDWDENVFQEYESNRQFCILNGKDLAIAPSGAWFVDLESIREMSDDREQAQRKQGAYMLYILRDFIRIITQARVGHEYLKEDTLQLPAETLKEIKRDTVQTVLETANRSDLVQIRSSQERCTIEWRLPHGGETFCQSYENDPLWTQYNFYDHQW